MSYVYYFEDTNKEIIYVGHTKNIHSRMRNHFGSTGHLEERCYTETNLVYYAKLNSLNEARLYEIYLIGKLKPKYNTVFAEGGVVTVELPPLDFKLYDLKKEDSALNDELLKSYKELLHRQIQQPMEEVKQSINLLKVLGTYQLDEFTQNTRLSRTDEAKFTHNNKFLELNYEIICKSLEQIEKVIGCFEGSENSKTTFKNVI